MKRSRRTHARRLVLYAATWLLGTVLGAVTGTNDPILAASMAATTSTAVLALAIHQPHHAEDIAEKLLTWLEQDDQPEDDTDA